MWTAERHGDALPNWCTLCQAHSRLPYPIAWAGDTCFNWVWVCERHDLIRGVSNLKIKLKGQRGAED